MSEVAQNINILPLFTFSSRVPQHGVSNHHYGPAEHVSKNKHMKLLQALIHRLLLRFGTAVRKTHSQHEQDTPENLRLQLHI